MKKLGNTITYMKKKGQTTAKVSFDIDQFEESVKFERMRITLFSSNFHSVTCLENSL